MSGPSGQTDTGENKTELTPGLRSKAAPRVPLTVWTTMGKAGEVPGSVGESTLEEQWVTR